MKQVSEIHRSSSMRSEIDTPISKGIRLARALIRFQHRVTERAIKIGKARSSFVKAMKEKLIELSRTHALSSAGRDGDDPVL